MKSLRSPALRKRPLNLTLNEDVVVEARRLADNLSGLVERLLTDYVADARRQRNAKARAVEASMAKWNEFTTRHGSFADEHSTL